MSKTTKKSTDPIDSPKEVKESKDPKIDQDVPGFPSHPSSKEDLKKKDPANKTNKK
ncbi:hypothetical protein U0035_17795 [Niabella yanshanensis]|uniref:Uncharacterized protein n=1 Tax=Niabella yanshanensis TaxID=577386 RepID=A0ABZ0W4T7_9BACT|nr:hypothetical protein [Niabella yanshanensis]WQD37527.1 hypothetical protein U0035_17795 [Niabella yanshanensis]